MRFQSSRVLGGGLRLAGSTASRLAVAPIDGPQSGLGASVTLASAAIYFPSLVGSRRAVVN